MTAYSRPCILEEHFSPVLHDTISFQKVQPPFSARQRALIFENNVSYETGEIFV